MHLNIPTTAGRVPEHTPEAYNQEIRRQAEARLAYYATAGSHAIAQRLEELDREWDIERALEANAASVSLVGLTLGALVDRRFFAIPFAVAGFLLQHAVQGWCPPLPVLRKLGFRTQGEIEEERYALKAIRGDFRTMPLGMGDSQETMRSAVRATRS